jgi:chromosomal replication initiation ATPase DnaA
MRELPQWFHQEARSADKDRTAMWHASQPAIADRTTDAIDIGLLRMRKCVHYVTDSSGTGKTHVALALGLAACQRGHRVRFTTTAALVSELIEARDDKKLLRFQKQIASYELLIVDELGFVPLSKTGAELLFEMLSQRYERGSTMVTSNLPFQEWTEVLGSERLTGALLDRLG